MKARVLGSIVGAAIGFIVGGGTGIVGGIFGARAGVLVFTIIGAFWGWSAGPDLAQTIKRWRGK
jgi:uncharacterized protein YcfJ